MAKYGLNTNVLNTYVADFHGTTVTLFEQSSTIAKQAALHRLPRHAQYPIGPGS